MPKRNVTLFLDLDDIGSKNEGFIYFVQQNENGPIKIGWTRNRVEKRVKILQNGNPDRLKIIYTMPGTIKHEKVI